MANKKDDDAEQSTIPSSNISNGYFAAFVAISVFGVIFWMYQERTSLRAETDALHAKLQEFSTDKMQDDLSRLGFSDGGKDQSITELLVADAGRTNKNNSENFETRYDDAQQVSSISSEGDISATTPEEITTIKVKETTEDSTTAPTPGVVKGIVQNVVCADMSPNCAGWAREGECQSNKDWMLGTVDVAGHCLKSCGKCDIEAAPAFEGSTYESGGGQVEISENTSPNNTGSQLAEMDLNAGSSTSQAASAQGDNFAGATPSVGAGAGGGSNPSTAIPVSSADPSLPSPSTSTLVSSSATSASSSSSSSPVDCVDLSSNCKSWAMHGECGRNVEYMMGGDGYEGQCRQSCGACKTFTKDAYIGNVTGTMAEDASAGLGVENVLGREHQSVLKPLRWPQKKAATGRLCVGLGTQACTRGLYNPKNAETLDPADRTVQNGVGGPTGCTEAWASLLSSDDQIPGMLNMLYTLRKFAQDDRDILILVTPSVTQPYITMLLEACVIVKLVSEPMDPSTHMGFVKLNLWLNIEYTNIAFIEYDAWIRADPGEVFTFTAPAAIKTAPHARLMNEMFGSYFFLLKPGRQMFYDMLAKVGTIDSAEVVDDKTIYTERLFFSGYFEKWYIMPSTFLEFQQDIVSTIIPELTNTRLRRVVKSLPPYSTDTIIDFSLINARGVFANLHVKPWHPGWHIPCAWECRYRKFHQLYEAVAVEWWEHYYNLVDLPLPTDRALYNIVEQHDVHNLYTKKEFEHCLPFNCDVPQDLLKATKPDAKPQTKAEKRQAAKRGM
mmetsp:Transcript_25570/g.35289  ORF Transcript_25570/g.35289 Transcript_25570/m.35289 type:complete len:783 (-) Transcript_25570:255-2603(-)|eukprot:CAMPEP_0196578468 /NCGR_PEP_ID=MMETSP1081-20130531/7360_1 /TAXON_ID=36882 /ORGANISM="Pyramimonas amylifera, Strain CCMP720" /LENGTH=782 /DNA_ID=CAMNT_0041897697 /DNA_START=99 /DNA_END=2447 /DNA_ORIENTATION=+